MGRIANACNDHITRWVIPAATRLLIESASKGIATQPLDKIVHIEMGQSPKSESYNTIQDGIPFIGGPADLGIKFPVTKRWTNAPTKLCQTGDLIICVRATIGEPRWADGVYCLGRGVAGLRPADKNLDSGFLFRVIQANEQDLREKGTGTTFKTISKKHIAAIPIPMISLEVQRAISNFLEWLASSSGKGQFDFTEAPLLPASLTEQRRIVARIESLAAKVEAARKLREQAEEAASLLLSSTLREIFINYEEGKDCEHTTLGEATQLQRGRFSHRPRNEPMFFGGDHPWIQIGEIESAGKYITVYTKTLNDMGLKISRKFPKGTLLISIAATIGAVGILAFDCCVPDSVVAVTPYKEKATSEFLYYYLMYVRNYLEEIAPQSAQKNINLRILNPLPISLPPLPEQRRIVAYLDALQAKVAAVQQHQAVTQARLEALMPAILDQAFRGEL